MEYLLLGAFVIGLLLFVLSWLRVIFAGFNHHFITGLFSIVLVLNLLVLPSLWHRVYRWVLTGAIGLLVAIGCWYAGADQHVYRYTHNTDPAAPTTQGGIGVTGLDLNRDNLTVNANGSDNNSVTPVAVGKALPKSALYSMSYQEIASTGLGQYIGHYVRLTRIDRKRFEGKVLAVDDKGVIIERRVDGNILEQRINFNDIKQSEIMKKAR